MKAKDLIKILSKNPEAEIIFTDYIGIEVFQEVKSAQLFTKGSVMNLPVLPSMSNCVSIDKNRKCKTDVIYLSRDK